jgi:glutamyl-tRNA synthetase
MWFLQKKHALRYASTSSDASTRNLMKLAVKPVLKCLEERINAGADLPFYIGLSQAGREHLVSTLVRADAQNYTSPNDFIDRNLTFFQPPSADMLERAPSAFDIFKGTRKDTYDLFLPSLNELRNIPVANWTTDEIKACTSLIISSQVCEPENVGIKLSSEQQTNSPKKGWSTFVHGYLRWAVSAGRPGPDGSLAMSLLGKEETLRRLDTAQKTLTDALILSVVGSQGTNVS